MGQKSSCAFFLIALIMFATAKPLAHGQLLGGGGGGGVASLPDLLNGVVNVVQTILNSVVGITLGGGSGLLDNVLGGVNVLRDLIITLLRTVFGFTTANRLLTGETVPLPMLSQPSQDIISPLIQILIFKGRICCSGDGSCTGGGQPLPGALVTVNCTSPLGGGSIVIGQNRTDVNGNITIAVGKILSLFPGLLSSGLLPCSASVNASQVVCPSIELVNGLLYVVLGPVRLVLNKLLGLILTVVLGL